MISLQELQADLNELESLLKNSNQKRTKNLLEKEILAVKYLIENEKKTTPQTIQLEKREEKNENSPQITYSIIKKYSWDQEGKNVKLYIGLEDIGQIENSNIDFQVDKEGFDLKISKDNKAGWRLNIKKLCGSVDVAKCKYVLKSKNIIVTLVKEKDGYWSQLPYKESAVPYLFSDNSKLNTEKEKLGDKDVDPSKSLMDMMKKMYEEGDDEMKKTIAQAWSKSQSEKGAKPEF